jgi:hypothetical protein
MEGEFYKRYIGNVCLMIGCLNFNINEYKKFGKASVKFAVTIFQKKWYRLGEEVNPMFINCLADVLMINFLNNNINNI